MTQSVVTVIGAGLAGCEAAWQLANAGMSVELVEMKPRARTPAQVSDHFAELVCSNSLRSRNPSNAVGLLKVEMEALDSLIIQAALEAQVPAGDALAVDREKFSGCITEALRSHRNIKIREDIVERLPDTHVVVATGPLTHDTLAEDIGREIGTQRLYFYDAIAPIIAGTSINREVVFAQSRYDKGEGADYLNCPMDRAEYERFLAAMRAAECMPAHSFEKPVYFQGCLPVEVMAERGDDALRFGPMKPVGLTDPRTGRRPYAVVQLRREDVHGQAWNLVGFQTKMKYPDQQRVFRMIPGLEEAEFLRLGAVHRNTYLDSPSLLDERMRLKSKPNVRFAGQITGVEGYVESAAHGLLCGRVVAMDLGGPRFEVPPETTALGALWRHVTGQHKIAGRAHEPANINWSMFPPTPEGVKKSQSKEARVERARAAFEGWRLGLR